MEKKRSFDEPSDGASSSPEAKRFHAETLLDMLDDDEDAGSRGGGGPDADALASVIKILEEEIALPSPPAPELGYLFEAFDYELGLPPVMPSPAAEAAATGNGEVPLIDDLEELGEGEIMSCSYWTYDGIGFRTSYEDCIVSDLCVADDAEESEYFYAVDLFGAADVEGYRWSDLSCRKESLPAV